MNTFRFMTKILAVATFMFAFAALAQAQATRTWVSGVGDDANPCSRTAPCKTFAGAISKTAACGEIDALDPGGFGAVTITKSITIDGTGTLAGILASLTTGVIVNATANDVITIRGLSINGACNGIRGMNILQAKEVNLEDCVIFRFANEGILVNESNDIQLNIRNSVVRDNAGDGLSIASSGGVARATAVNSSFNGNLNGIHSKSNGHVSALDCVLAANASTGANADGIAGTSTINLSRCSISNNSFGVQGGGGSATALSIVRLSDCDLYQNTNNATFIATNGEIDTFQNNRILGNGTNGCLGCLSKLPN